MMDDERIEELTKALKLISETLEILDTRITQNTTLIATVAGIDIQSMRQELINKKEEE
tara:strand:+ start:146 stop:319 length:174 start_codon:yes stop_codon:yes gene_type:complete